MTGEPESASCTGGVPIALPPNPDIDQDPVMKQTQPSSNVRLDFQEKYIPDERERLKYLLERYVSLLARDAAPASRKNHQLIASLLKRRTAHAELLGNIAPIFATADARPRPLILGERVERALGPNRCAEYLGYHADISYMVVRHLNKGAGGTGPDG